MSEDLGMEGWDARYRAQAALWSSNPNRYLVSETAGERAADDCLAVVDPVC
jgi:hypothetical protein